MNSKYMIIRNFTILLISYFIIISCTGKQEKPDREGIIPEKDLLALFKEIHLADGLLANPRIQNWVFSIDSMSTYHYIAEKHGYTKEEFDKTLYYYFIRKPKKLTKIYDKILGELSEMESRLEKEVTSMREKASNVWSGERNYYFPDNTDISAVGFQFSLVGNRIYNLKFTATIYPDDQSVNTRAVAYSYDADSVLTGKKTRYETPVYLKDGIPHTYTIRIFVSSGNAFILKGTLYDQEICIEEWRKHARFENITLSMPSSDI